MIRVGNEWVANGNIGQFDKAYRNRGEFANISNFDMHITSNLTEDYGFVTLRLGVALEKCGTNKTLWYKNVTDWYFWCDYGCNNFAGIESLNPTPAEGKFLNMSLLRKERCNVQGGM